jgi:hypothetical protein
VRLWQPHYHVIALADGPKRFKPLRERFFSFGSAVKGMVVKPKPDLGWPSYAAKRTAFRKAKNTTRTGRTYTTRKRLHPAEEREHLRYLAKVPPTRELFCVNCSVLRRRRQVERAKKPKGKTVKGHDHHRMR